MISLATIGNVLLLGVGMSALFLILCRKSRHSKKAMHQFVCLTHCLRLVRTLFGKTETFVETINTTAGINQFLSACEERMTL